ncbi:MAG: pyridoxal phosphate-dependent aminotransferase [Calditrichaeota bacterium]|nr:pyridoxal phosphate-dependent aminotransferase [Calditrichota bacterium]
MPRFPQTADRIQHLEGSVFEKFREKMKAQGDKLVRLHIGDTYLQPVYSLPINSSFMEQHRMFHRYCHTYGIDRIRKALVTKLQEDNHLPVSVDNILLTSGATNALSIAVHTLVNPGEDVLVLTPAWPFFFGMVNMAGAKVIEVPFYTRLFHNPDFSISEYLARYLTPQTVAIYVNTPNNPSGKVLDAQQLQQIGEFARQHRLWIISDEAYDGLTYDGRPHISIGQLPGLFDQTLTVFTFSKIFMFAGLRLGYLVASSEMIHACNRTLVHQLYSPSTLAQYMMIDPIQTRHQWMPRVQRHYQELRDRFIHGLEISVPVPEGTYFIFFSLKPFLNGRDYWQLFHQLLENGVSVAPGQDFGRDFQDYVRLCFTGEPPERLQIAIDRLNRFFKTLC